MGLNSEYKKSIKTTTGLILDLTVALSDIKYFQDVKQKAQIDVVKAYRFLWRAQYGIYVTFCLNYNKVVMWDEDPSLQRILNESINHYKGLQWNRKPDKKLLIEYLETLKDLEKSEISQNLKLARDRYYAHFDKNRPTKIQIETDDIDKNLLKIQEIFNYILLHYENRQYHFGFSQIDIGHHIFDNLYKYKQIKLALIESKKTLDRDLKLDNLREIIIKNISS